MQGRVIGPGDPRVGSVLSLAYFLRHVVLSDPGGAHRLRFDGLVTRSVVGYIYGGNWTSSIERDLPPLVLPTSIAAADVVCYLTLHGATQHANRFQPLFGKTWWHKMPTGRNGVSVTSGHNPGAQPGRHTRRHTK